MLYGKKLLQSKKRIQYTKCMFKKRMQLHIERKPKPTKATNNLIKMLATNLNRYFFQRHV